LVRQVELHINILVLNYRKKGKGKVHPCTVTEALYRPYGPKESRGIFLPFLDHGTRRGKGSASRPGRFLPPGKTRYPLYGRLTAPQGPSGQMWKISPPPGLAHWTVQPVASRYTDYSTRPTSTERALLLFIYYSAGARQPGLARHTHLLSHREIVQNVHVCMYVYYYTSVVFP
jgi:hypothetical protein